MAVILVDSCIITDLAAPDSEWFEWSSSMLEQLDANNTFVINPITYEMVQSSGKYLVTHIFPSVGHPLLINLTKTPCSLISTIIGLASFPKRSLTSMAKRKKLIPTNV